MLDDSTAKENPERVQQGLSLLRYNQYRSYEANPGDLILFPQDVPHYGTANHSPSSPRLVLFVAVKLSTDQKHDTNQLTRYNYYHYAFGSDSLEYAEALISCVQQKREMNPIGKLKQTGQSRSIRCLMRHNLWELYLSLLGDELRESWRKIGLRLYRSTRDR